ncbi:hypothetical protein IQA64_15810 [Leptospira borgpetersenii serovar Tarassovi]|nr:hypothetical protein [Leptospira borgpetersenii serovar Balcanica]MBE8398893.1 hypothetical protein [Leptospira borgpetersenii serovar Tarassovi]MBE8367703.1 hypothetical protein [Leptospira borgpetersenii serovar Balcanica]MBE8402026.1 hypothetical protein [Leptospira borgpetersenii serovar Tarassovi]MBE8405013.1 hypothetical protein [Leptospira borgpetersenii serovar Tarassovi]
MTGKLNSIYERNQEELLPDFEFYRNRNCRVCISFSDGKRVKIYNKRKDLFFRNDWKIDLFKNGFDSFSLTKDDSTEDEPVEYLPTMASRVNPTLVAPFV